MYTDVTLLQLQMTKYELHFPGTFSVAYGVVADLAISAERGSNVGVVAFG